MEWHIDKSNPENQRYQLNRILSDIQDTIDALGGGSGTVTSVDVSVGTGMTVSGAPVTTSGTINLGLSSNLQAWSALATSAKADTSHGHVAADVSDFSEAVDDRVSNLLVAGTNITLTYNDGGGTLTIDAAGGGSDPWTYVVLGSDFSTTSSSPVNVTGMLFNGFDANSVYEFEGVTYTRTSSTSDGPRPGFSWPSGLSDGVAEIRITTSGNGQGLTNGNINNIVLAPLGGHTNTALSWPGFIKGSFVTGGSPSGDFQLTLASETSGTSVTLKAGTFIKYRKIA